MVIGRTDYFALGVTNAYGDSQDLYVETVDPDNSDRYLEGEKSIKFKVIDEVIKVKDKEAPGGFRDEKYQIKLTRRGPVISDALKDLKTDKLMTLRFSISFLTFNSAVPEKPFIEDIINLISPM